MKAKIRDCELLRPALVALVYDESHPELPRLMAHLEVCERCRKEEDDLCATRAWVDDSADSLTADLLTVGVFGESEGKDPAGARRGLLPRISNVVAGAAVAFLIFWLLLKGGDDTLDGNSGSLSDGQSDPLWTEAVLSFEGTELDRRLDWLDGEVGLLTDSGGDAW